MKTLDFYSLPRSLQDRFVESSRGASLPLPIAVRLKADPRPLLWAALSALGLLGWGAFASHGFGELSSSAAIGGHASLVVHVVCALFVTFCATRSYGYSWLSGRLPYAEGAYLFPAECIVVRGAELSVYSAAGLSVPAGTKGFALVDGETGARFTFEVPPGPGADKARELFEQGKARLAQLTPESQLEMARLSCLAESGVPNPLAPTRPHPRPRLGPAVLLPILAVVSGALLGGSAWLYRNSLSEKALYRAAVTQNSVAAYEQYLVRTGASARADVAEVFLPRAELHQAIQADTVDAVVKFAERRPATKIAPEIEAALRLVLLKELKKAQEAGTLEALRAVELRYPGQIRLVATELQAARHAVYQTALSAFLEKAPDSEPLHQFVTELLGVAETSGPVVQVRFSQQFEQDPAILDSIVKKSEKYYLGRRSLPSQYFLGQQARDYEKWLGERIVTRLQEAFPPDVLKFELALLPTVENEPLAPVSAPTLTVVHKESLSGGFVGGAPKNMYLGATIRISATFEAPGIEKPFSYHFSAWRNPNYAAGETGDKQPTDIEKVYQTMMMGALEEFLANYSKKWFR